MPLLDPRLVRRARAVRVMLAADALLGLAAALLVLAQAVLLAQVSARAFGGASLAEVRVPLALFCAAAVGRAAAAWGFEVVGRRAATDVLAALRLDVVERRLRGGARRFGQRRCRDARRDRRRRAGSDVRPVPATGRARRRRTGRGARARRGGRSALRGDHAVDAPARARVHVADRALHGATRAGAVGCAVAARDALPRRRSRAPDASCVQPRAGADCADRRDDGSLPQGDDGNAASRVPLGRGARVRGDARDRADRSDGRRAARCRRGRLRGGARRCSCSLPSCTCRCGTSRRSTTRAPTAAPSRERLLDVVDAPVDDGSRLDPIAEPSRGHGRLEGVSLFLSGPRGAGARRRRSGAPPARDRCARRPERGREEHRCRRCSSASRTPHSGVVRVGAVDLRSCELAGWRARLAWVPQRPTLFRGTVADNIRLGAPSADAGQVRAAAGLVGADDFIRSLRDGYDTVVGDGGRPLSAGQLNGSRSPVRSCAMPS